MPTRKIPSYRHQKARNLAVVRIDGKDHYLGVYDSPESHQEYERLIAQWLKRQQIKLGKIPNITLCELMAAFLSFAREYYLKRGKLTREFGCISEVLGEVRKQHEATLVDDFGPKKLKDVRNQLVQLGWSRKYVNKQTGRIVRMFKWGVSEELVRPEVYQALKTVGGLRKGRTEAAEHAPIEPVSDEAVEATLTELSPLVGDMVQFHRLTGCRPTEVCLLMPSSINDSRDVWIYIPCEHKMEHQERQRAIFVGPKAQQIIKPYLGRADDSFCFDPREAPGARKNSKYRYTKDSYGRAVRRAIKRVNRRAQEAGKAVWLKPWSPNQLRHTAATQIRQQFGIEGAQVILGHSSADVTQVYAERDLKLAENIARKLG